MLKTRGRPELDSASLSSPRRRNGRAFPWLLAGGVLLFALSGIVRDVASHAAPSEILEQSAARLAVVLALAFLWVKADSLRRTTARLRNDLETARRELEAFRRRTRALSDGLGEAIEWQLNAWGLTRSEKEVARLLLKGLGHRSIAEIRQTTEKTVRQQAASVYQKAGLSGRAELSAFFLEDLLVLPSGASGVSCGVARGP